MDIRSAAPRSSFPCRSPLIAAGLLALLSSTPLAGQGTEARGGEPPSHAPTAAVQNAAAQNAVVQNAADSSPADSSGSVDADGFRPLFDGRTLQQWEGDRTWFRVENGSIVAGSLEKKIPHNVFLCTEQEFGDFELRLEARLAGEGNNAGVQFRTRRIEGSSEVAGYQADMGAAGGGSVWGALYDESRRRKMLAQPDPVLVRRVLREGGWNDLVIRCRGPQIEIYLNGVQTVDYTETDGRIEPKGIIGLQIHGGPPAEARYRNIRIKSL